MVLYDIFVFTSNKTDGSPEMLNSNILHLQNSNNRPSYTVRPALTGYLTQRQIIYQHCK